MSISPRLTPHEYQEQSIVRALAERTSEGGTGAVLLGDEQGAGKTLVVAEILRRAFGENPSARVLLLVLKDTIVQWDERIQAQGGPALRVMDGTKRGRAEFAAFLKGEPGWFITSSQFFVRQDWAYRDKLNARGETVPVIDKQTGMPTGKVQRERVHLETYRKMSNRKAGGVDAVIVDEIQLFSNRTAIGVRTLRTMRGNDLNLAASGTWFGEQIQNMWAVCRWLWPIEEIVQRSFHRWKEQWLRLEPVTKEGGQFVETENPVTGHREVMMKIVGEITPGAFTATLPCYLRWENPERAPEPKRLLLPPAPAQAAQMVEFNRDLMAWLATREGDEMPLPIQIPATLQARLLQVTIASLSFADEFGTEVTMADDAESAKLGALRGVLEDYFKGEPALIFTHSKVGAKFIARRMQAAGLRVGVWHGDLSTEERAALKVDFIDGGIDYLVATIQSCGTGVDGLQLRTSKIVWISKVPGRPAMNEQALFRVWRPGIVGGRAAFQHVELLIDHPGSADTSTLDALLAQAWHNLQALRGAKPLSAVAA